MVDSTCVSYFSARSSSTFDVQSRRIRPCKGYLCSNDYDVMLFVSYVYRYVPLKISNISGDNGLFKLVMVLNVDDVTIRRKFTWDVLEIKRS